MENASRGWKTLRGGQGKRFAGVRLGFRFSATGIDMAGASVNGGYTHSETDEYCYDITADPGKRFAGVRLGFRFSAC